MVNFTTLQDAIYDWVNGQTGLECIWAFQNVIIPDKPFYSLRLTGFQQIGDAQAVEASAPVLVGDVDIYSNVDFGLEVQGFGPGVFNKTVNLKFSLNSQVVHDQLKSAGVISWNDTNPVQELSGLDNDQNEERAIYEADFRTSSILTNVPYGAIEIVNIDATIKNQGKSDITRALNVDSTL